MSDKQISDMLNEQQEFDGVDMNTGEQIQTVQYNNKSNKNRDLLVPNVINNYDVVEQSDINANSHFYRNITRHEIKDTGGTRHMKRKSPRKISNISKYESYFDSRKLAQISKEFFASSEKE